MERIDLPLAPASSRQAPLARCRLSLILPAYNEADRIPASLERIGSYLSSAEGTEVIVVDDGSVDQTALLVEHLAESRPWLRLIRKAHRGKGAAVRSGVRDAQATELVAFLDADLTIPIEVLDSLVAAVREGADVAVASRYVPGAIVHRPIIRQAMTVGFRFFVRALVPTALQDTQCGAKCYRAEVARDLYARSRIDGFAFDAEVLYIARLRGYRLVELPVALIQDRRTSIHLLRDTFRMVRDLARIRLNAMRGKYA
ncbi:MAG: glycosyltransferase [Chloroflexi bacterium]|nr:MAG: glycosyltransferase [Chloroflexota bacterium]